MEQVILVDEQDNEIGLMEKMEAHEKALLHRAFSVFIFNSKGEMLLQQRALTKYHSGGLWTNSCCSHPRQGEKITDAATRRLKEEMGFEVPMEKIFDFIYKAPFMNGLTEYEFDHVFVGYYDGPVHPNPIEVENYAFRSFERIERLMDSEPEFYTAWFKIAFPKVKAWWQQNKMQ
ncbi:MAG: isopentenyl-diphosphate Delta-isomerase [Sediminibacterium sp.]|nr:MAG: isopentenyl-diphosphate [Chitinophagaceae bacterium]MDP1844596.1 isopentenyl-diphosphate Delta-isomerase [Sediminibacterium sp.]TXT32733.1 MAG: isopentenyl-diphosphate delta-isomerase [Chitinophagaceae bacterium]